MLNFLDRSQKAAKVSIHYILQILGFIKMRFYITFEIMLKTIIWKYYRNKIEPIRKEFKSLAKNDHSLRYFCVEGVQLSA